MSCTSCGNSSAAPSMSYATGGTMVSMPVAGSGFFQSLHGRICFRCWWFWVLVAVVAIALVKRKDSR